MGDPARPLFWSIRDAWLFYALAAVAVAALAGGLWRNVARWRQGTAGGGLHEWRRRLALVALDGVLGRRIWRGEPAAGAMHLLVFWGFGLLFAGTVLSVLDHYVVPFLHGRIYLVFSACLEVAGLMLLAGLLWALGRRYVQRAARLERRAADLLVPLWLGAVALSGFLVEGLRLAVQRPPGAGWSFGGLALGALWPAGLDAAAVYPVLWWAHALLSLGLLAALPHTRLLHVVAAPVSIYLGRDGTQAASATPAGESAGPRPRFWPRARGAADGCTRCGRCVQACPAAGAGEALSPRELVASVRELARGGPDAAWDPGHAWHCTSCGACLEVCPIYVPTPEAVREIRRAAVEEGTRVPASLAEALAKLRKYANPWDASKKTRSSWSKGLGLPDLSKAAGSAALCYFVGCTTAPEARAQQAARALVELLRRAGVSFGTLGGKEPCCGDIARRAGEDGLFEEQSAGLVELLGRAGVGRIVTASPHCAHLLRSEYPALGLPGFAACHYVELLDELVAGGALPLGGRVAARATYHDPCYLGRYAGVVDAPRRLLRAVAGLELVEMAHAGRLSRCCGGGGGRMWQPELAARAKMSEIRIHEAAATRAELLVTACPLCLVMLEDARKTTPEAECLRVLDLAELLVMALGPSTESS
ncbi:MAG: (Fe-S)-binding protein [Deltaproteobacteria bacterium]|nr:(Fe-S)-binding protein [Deltaproteobacteria bacterium]